MVDQVKNDSPIKKLPRVQRLQGAKIGYGHDAVALQYTDAEGQWYELAMSLGDALYLLSILKGTQLDLDIPFPDDPRDPDALPVRPSEVGMQPRFQRRRE